MAGTLIDIGGDSGRFGGYLALPPSGSGPGIVMLQEIFGVNAGMRAVADLFAEEGYIVLVPDLFWRIQPGIEVDCDKASFDKALGFRQQFDVNKGVDDIAAAIQTLRAQPGCTGEVAALGFCLGGLLAYLSAARLPVDAAVSFYGGDIDRSLEEAAHIHCPLLLHFGGEDARIPMESVNKVRAAFKGREDVSIQVYPDAEHGFYLPVRSSHNHVAARLAHSATIGLLRQSVGPRYDLSALWDRHCQCEFDLRDVEATMKTMVAQPYVNHIPTMTGGVGYEQLHRFYKNHFLSRLPKDTRIVPISRTIGTDRVVDEMLFCFTHDCEIDFMLPGVPPTSQYVEIPLVAIVCFRGDKLYNEHIYWDQASVLAQIGLLDASKLPIAGIETARKLRDETLPSNTLMARWAETG